MTFQTLPTRKQVYTRWMAIAYKQEKIQRTSLPYRMRLAAITAADNRPGRHIQSC